MQIKFSALPTTGSAAEYATFGTTQRARFDSLLVLMRNGGVYVNVHTRVNGGGEIRGQIGPR